MGVTDGPSASAGRPPAGGATTANDIYGARLFASDMRHVFSDVRVAALLGNEACEQVVTKVFGIPRQSQSFLVKALMAGAAVTVLGDFVSRLPLVRPSRTDTAMGGFVLNSALRGIAGEPSRSIPAAGVVIACALLLRALRSAETTSAHDARILTHDVHARYAHHPATPVAGGGAA